MLVCKLGVYMYVIIKEGIYIVNCDIGKYIIYEVILVNMLFFYCIFEEMGDKEIIKLMMID